MLLQRLYNTLSYQEHILGPIQPNHATALQTCGNYLRLRSAAPSAQHRREIDLTFLPTVLLTLSRPQWHGEPTHLRRLALNTGSNREVLLLVM